MARWFLFGLTIFGFGLAFVAKSPGLLAVGLLVGLVAFIGFIFALAAARVSASARPESSMVGVDELAMMRRRAPRPGAAPSSTLPPPAPPDRQRSPPR